MARSAPLPEGPGAALGPTAPEDDTGAQRRRLLAGTTAGIALVAFAVAVAGLVAGAPETRTRILPIVVQAAPGDAQPTAAPAAP